MYFLLGLFVVVILIILLSLVFKIPKTQYKKVTLSIFFVMIISLFVFLFSLFIHGMVLGSLTEVHRYGRYSYDTSGMFITSLSVLSISAFLGFISLFFKNKNPIENDEY